MVQKKVNKTLIYRVTYAICCIIIGLSVGRFISNRVVSASKVVGNSMNPTYEDGNLVCVFKFKPDVERNDIVVFLP